MIKYILIFLFHIILSFGANAQQPVPSQDVKEIETQEPVEATSDKKYSLPPASVPPATVQGDDVAAKRKTVEEKKKLPRDAITGKTVTPKTSPVKKERLRDSVRKKIKDKKNPAN